MSDNHRGARWMHGDRRRSVMLLFAVEMWERFSFYGMRSFLVLFLVAPPGQGGFGWDEGHASRLFGWYTGLVYLTPLVGGFLADRTLGTHAAILVGGAAIALGHLSLAAPLHWTFFPGLALIIVGTGFHKSNISTMVGQLFDEGDERRDRAFVFFYMGISAGAMLGPAICDSLAENPRFGWHWGFGAACLGMVVGLALYVGFKRRLLGDVGKAPTRQPQRSVEEPLPRASLSPLEKRRLAALGVLALFTIVFWTGFEQAGSSLTFFAKNRVDEAFCGLRIPVGWYQMVIPISVVAQGPAVQRLWALLRTHGREPSTPAKFAAALFFVSTGFAVMTCAAQRSDAGVKVGAGWLLATYVLHAIGELCLSPVGLTMVTKLAPRRMSSLVMGAWFLCNFVASVVAGFVASAAENVERGDFFVLLGGRADFFLTLVVVSALAGTLLLLLSGRIVSMMELPVQGAPRVAAGERGFEHAVDRL